MMAAPHPDDLRPQRRPTKPITYLGMALVMLALACVQGASALRGGLENVQPANAIAAAMCALVAPLALWRYFVLKQRNPNAG
jgi:hypothetical protein